jgi:nucleotide-binding universal stress UspA family protein
MTKILVPTDGSTQAEAAGENAIASINIPGGEVIVLYVIDTSYLDALPQHDLRESLRKELREEGERAVNKFRQQMEDAQCEGYCKNVNMITMLKEGKPADVILKTIDEEGVDQVIIGKSGKHGVDKLILGSTTDRVVRGAKVPVNVIS